MILKSFLVLIAVFSGCATAPSEVAPAEPRSESVPPLPAVFEGFEIGQPDSNTLDPVALQRLIDTAKSEKSSSLIVVQNGKLVVNETFGADPQRTMLAMSVTKSVAALGIGVLVDNGHLDLDTPLSKVLIPEWKDDERRTVTLRHILTHSSGLDLGRYGMKENNWKTGTIESHLSTTALKTEPGRTFAYNNNAVDILSVIARRAEPEGLYFDDFIDWAIFGGIRASGAFWSKDGRGDPRAAGELSIRPIDLAKVGLLVLNKGRANGKQLVSEQWIEQMLAGQPLTDRSGLLWWRDGRATNVTLSENRIEKWVKAGVDSKFIEKSKSIVGQVFGSREQAHKKLREVIGEKEFGDLKSLLQEKRTRLFDSELELLAYRADGWLGQFIIIVPSANLVAVRTRDPRTTSWKPEEYSYMKFGWDVLSVAGLEVPESER